MELAEKMDTGQNQTKKRRQSSENVSFFLIKDKREHLTRSEFPHNSTIYPFIMKLKEKCLFAMKKLEDAYESLASSKIVS